MPSGTSKRLSRAEERRRDRKRHRDMESYKVEINTASDRAVAIIAVANLEALVGDLIVTKLKRQDDKTIDRLHERDGPLGSFFSKIELAYALGLISEDTTAELHKFRRIRNLFAHAPSIVDFKTDRVKVDVFNINLRPELVEYLDKGHSQESLPAKEYFTTHALLYHADILSGLVKAQENENRRIKRRLKTKRREDSTLKPKK